jgi:hypothetical protein
MAWGKAAKPAEKIMRGWLYPLDGAHPLGKTGKRAAERAQRAETPCKNSTRETVRRFAVSAKGAPQQPIGVTLAEIAEIVT